MVLAFLQTQATGYRARLEEVKQGDAVKAVAAAQGLPEASLPDAIVELERLDEQRTEERCPPTSPVALLSAYLRSTYLLSPFPLFSLFVFSFSSRGLFTHTRMLEIATNYVLLLYLEMVSLPPLLAYHSVVDISKGTRGRQREKRPRRATSRCLLLSTLSTIAPPETCVVWGGKIYT